MSIRRTAVAAMQALLLVAALTFSPSVAHAVAHHSREFVAPNPTNIPGLTLRPGSYKIEAVGELSGRYVVRVEGPKEGVHYSFIALENPDIPKPERPGLVEWSNAADGRHYLRGWFFAGSPSVLEFVYPKDEAVAIAKSNQAKVPAIDPASEGRPLTIKGLSKNDLQVVTLWLLSATTVGPEDSSGGIQAERYTEVASVVHKPVIARLPQTSSSLPWIALLSLFSLMAALALRMASAGRMASVQAGADKCHRS